MFHVERDYGDILARSVIGGAIDEATLARLTAYADMVVEANDRFNLTGHRDHGAIFEDLVLGSIAPLARLDVPRGTFLDIGTGAGVPGIPLAIFFPSFTGTLLDSNVKKTAFIDEAVRAIGVSNVSAQCARAEEAAHDGSLRSTFDWVFTRALAAPYVSIELGAAFLREGGLLYIFSKDDADALPGSVVSHAGELGLDAVGTEARSRLGIAAAGCLFVKKRPTPNRFPRRFAVIKRDSERHCNP